MVQYVIVFSIGVNLEKDDSDMLKERKQYAGFNFVLLFHGHCKNTRIKLNEKTLVSSLPFSVFSSKRCATTKDVSVKA